MDFYYNTDFPTETLVVYTWATHSISSYLTMDLDADDSSGESPVDFASALIAGNGPVAAADVDAFISNSASNLTSLTATILDLPDGASEVLACNTSGTAINASYNTSTGTLTLSNADTVSRYEQVLRTITYNNTAGTPTEGVRRIIFAASNASGSVVTNSATAFITVSLFGVNNPPIGADGTLTVAEDSTYTLLAADFSYSDTEGDPLVQVQITALPLNGNLAYNAGAVTLNQVISKADIDLGLLTYTPEPNTSGSGYADFDFKVHDGSDYSIAAYTLTIDVTGVNDAPNGPGSTIVMAEDTTYTLTIDDFGYTDPDGDPLNLVKITALPSNGTLAYNGDPVTLNQTISRADIDLDLLTYTPAADNYGIGYSYFRFRVHDGTQYALAFGTLLFDVTPVNDPPSISDQRFTIDRSLTKGGLVGTVQASDADPEDTLTYTISAQNPGELFVMDADTGDISLNNGADVLEASVSFYTFSAQVSDGNTSRKANITVQILDAKEASETDDDNTTDAVTPVPITIHTSPQDTGVDEAADSQEPRKPAQPGQPVDQDNGETPDETAGEEFDASKTQSQSHMQSAIPPRAGRVERTVAGHEPQTPAMLQYKNVKKSEPTAEKGLSSEMIAFGTNEPQWILDTPLDKIDIEGQGTASTWFGKLFVGTITIVVSLLSMLVTWGLQGSSLLAGVLSAIPLWHTFDPLPILDARHEEEEEQLRFGSEYQDIQSDKAEAMFDNVSNEDPEQKRRKDLR